MTRTSIHLVQFCRNNDYLIRELNETITIVVALVSFSISHTQDLFFDKVMYLKKKTKI